MYYSLFMFVASNNNAFLFIIYPSHEFRKHKKASHFDSLKHNIANTLFSFIENNKNDKIYVISQ